MLPETRPAELTAGRFAALFAAAFAVAAAPLLWVTLPPLVDYPNHLARMHIIAVGAASPILRDFYTITWRPLPDLAMDLVVPLLARAMPLLWAGKAFLLLTFLLLAGGTALLHHALFRRWSAWPCLAFLLLYSRSLLWGFANFLFGVGLGLVGAAAWVRLRDGPAAARHAVAVQRVLAGVQHHVSPRLSVLLEQEHLRVPLPGVQHDDRPPTRPVESAQPDLHPLIRLSGSAATAVRAIGPQALGPNRPDRPAPVAATATPRGSAPRMRILDGARARR